MQSVEKVARCSLRNHSLPKKKCQLSKITESILHICCLHFHIVIFISFLSLAKLIALPGIASPAWLYDTICNSLCIIYIISLAHVETAYQNNNNSSLFQSDNEGAEMFFTGSPGAEVFIYNYIKKKWLFCVGMFPQCCYVKSVTLNLNLSHVILPICPNLSLMKLVPSTCGLSVALINGYHTYSVCLTADKWLMKCWERRDGSSAGIFVWCQRLSGVPFSSKKSESLRAQWERGSKCMLLNQDQQRQTW